MNEAAKKIWDYMLMNHKLKKSDAIFVLGSIDERVPRYAASLFLEGYADLLIISGGSAHGNDLLATNWAEDTEAEHFANIAQDMGVPKERIIIEDKATNTGENIRFTQKLLEEQGIQISSFILVQKPYMGRRTYATFKKQWQGDAEITVASPPIRFEDYFDSENPKEMIVNIMVGDLQRIKEYPALGYQIEQEIPEDVWSAWQNLVDLGFDKHLISS